MTALPNPSSPTSGHHLLPSAAVAPPDRSAVRRLSLFFALVYLVEGVGQVGGLIAQPLTYYLKQGQGWSPLQVTAFLAIFNFPWIIKPVYGAFSDFVPLFGYRRKTYLVAANAVAIGAFVWATQLTAPSDLVWALQLTAYAMAISSTVCGAVLVENGQRLGESGRFVNQQWLCSTSPPWSRRSWAVSSRIICRRRARCTPPRRSWRWHPWRCCSARCF